jgi:hypothetical protein
MKRTCWRIPTLVSNTSNSLGYDWLAASLSGQRSLNTWLSVYQDTGGALVDLDQRSGRAVSPQLALPNVELRKTSVEETVTNSGTPTGSHVSRPPYALGTGALACQQ